MIQNIKYIKTTNILLLLFRFLWFINNFFTFSDNFFHIYYVVYFRHDKLQITMWSELAENFDEDVVRSMAEPIVIAFIGLSVK